MTSRAAAALAPRGASTCQGGTVAANAANFPTTGNITIGTTGTVDMADSGTNVLDGQVGGPGAFTATFTATTDTLELAAARSTSPASPLSRAEARCRSSTAPSVRPTRWHHGRGQPRHRCRLRQRLGQPDRQQHLHRSTTINAATPSPPPASAPARSATSARSVPTPRPSMVPPRSPSTEPSPRPAPSTFA